MAEIKWIKITTGMFEDEKIDFIESLPEADAILIIWIKLLTMAGRCNANGYIFLTEKIPYTPEMLAHKMRRSPNVVKLALETLSRLEMLTLEDNTIKVTNWEKHQNIEGMERIREQTRKRVARHREKRKELPSNVTCNATVTQSNATDIDKDIDIDKERDKDIYVNFVDGYHAICPSLSRVIKITEPRKRAMKARIDEFGLETIKTVLEKTEASDFLTGRTSDFKAGFDWILKPANFVKILEGNYDNRKPKSKEPLGGRVNVSAIEEYERLKNEGQL